MIDYNKYILWIQSESHESKDLIYVDGAVPSDENRQDVFSYIFPSNKEESGWVEIPIASDTKSKMGVTSSFRFYRKSPKEILITSNFITTDKKGRKIAYMFCTHFSTMEEVCKLLKNTCSNLGYQCNQADLLLLTTKIRLKKKSKLFTVVLIFVIALILWEILSCQN